MSLSDLKRRIGTIKKTSKIIKAMSLISAARMSRIKHLLVNYVEYRTLMSSIAASIAFATRNQFDDDLEVITIPNEVLVEAVQRFLGIDENYIRGEKNLLIVVTAEKGLCGSFNLSVVNCALALDDQNTDILCIGKKGYEILSRKGKHNILRNNYIELHLRQVNGKMITGQVTKPILQLIGSNHYSNVKIIHTEFISMFKQEVAVKQLFPIILEHKPEPEGGIEFDKKPTEMLKSIIPHYLHSIIYNSVLHSLKSETVKRMMAMDNASSNSQEMLVELTLEYNRVRQTKVTMELIEVISGMQ